MTMSNRDFPSANLLDTNPFRLLGLTTRDDRHKIVHQSEEQALHIDQASCQKARSDLINPRTRLAAEIGWLPGVSPRTAAILLDKLRANPIATALQDGLPELARANLMASALELVDPSHVEPSTLADLMRALGDTVDRLDQDTILRDVNEDRAVAGFPAVRDMDVLAGELV